MNWYKKALEIDPHHLRSRIAISVILSDANQDLDAMKILAEGATLQPDIAEYPYNLAILLEKNGKRKEAHAMYLHAVELNPYHISALNNLGAMAVEDESYPEARMYFERALKLSPNDADLLYNLESLP
jgi:tetratricopeptide (TPR) repeat protein